MCALHSCIDDRQNRRTRWLPCIPCERCLDLLWAELVRSELGIVWSSDCIPDVVRLGISNGAAPIEDLHRPSGGQPGPKPDVEYTHSLQPVGDFSNRSLQQLPNYRSVFSTLQADENFTFDISAG